MKDVYIGHQVNGYLLTHLIGRGQIGRVYKAERPDPLDVLACKVIPEDKLKRGWQREVQKVIGLRGINGVVQYHWHGTDLDSAHRPFVWVLWDYIPGMNLRDYLKSPPWPLDMAFTELIVETVLKVLHACRATGIVHGDLHPGNILIRDPDPRLPDQSRQIWVSDFGYGGSHNELAPKDDFRQLYSICSRLLSQLPPSSLGPRDKVMHHKLCDFLRKRVLEDDQTQGRYVREPSILLQDLERLRDEAERESAAAKGELVRGPGDYLAAEALGYRREEWKHLFVPEFLAAQELLSRNITVLTGARGCGKTMSFRRLTAFMDKVIGEPSGVKGADQFVGFYVNCRDFVEAFPWIPDRLTNAVQQQVIHYFHLAWFSEICRTLARCREDGPKDFGWLQSFVASVFRRRYEQLPQGADILSHVRAFVEGEKERCRLSPLGRNSGLDKWPLAQIDFLDRLQLELERHVTWIGDRPLYLFLDDYTIPIVPRQVQRLLNPIVFKRRSAMFFKISTEAATSFERAGLRDKPLELHQDFELIDLATESLHLDSRSKSLLVGHL